MNKTLHFSPGAGKGVHAAAPTGACPRDPAQDSSCSGRARRDVSRSSPPPEPGLETGGPPAGAPGSRGRCGGASSVDLARAVLCSLPRRNRGPRSAGHPHCASLCAPSWPSGGGSHRGAGDMEGSPTVLTREGVSLLPGEAALEHPRYREVERAHGVGRTPSPEGGWGFHLLLSGRPGVVGGGWRAPLSGEGRAFHWLLSGPPCSSSWGRQGAPYLPQRGEGFHLLPSGRPRVGNAQFPRTEGPH